MTVPPDDTTADTSAIITALQQRLDAALARETALAEILDLINRSPGDPQPVFSAILETAHTLCGADAGALMQFDGTNFRAVATHGLPDEFAAMVQQPFRGASHERLIHGDRIVHVDDARAVADWAMKGEVERAFVERTNLRTSLFVPLRKEGALLGFISADRHEVRPFTDTQITLLESFAAQAVIAMENARQLGELQIRTSDLQESLEYQTATSDVLKVIGGSTFDLQPVFDTIVTTAARLCEAGYANITTRESDGFRVVAGYSNLPDKPFTGIGRSFSVNRNSITGRTVLAQQFVHLVDVTLDPEYALLESARRTGMRSILGVPLIRDGVVVGTLNLGRVQVRPFTGRQIDLIRTFADQAVIAMENARLITETREALEQQTATAEVLQVINASPGDLTPVFDTILEKAHTRCGAVTGALTTFDGEFFHAVALRGYTEGHALVMQEPFTPNSLHQVLLRGERVAQIMDIRALHSEDHLATRRIIESTDVRSGLLVPLRKDGVLLGFISAWRREVRAFSEREITLLENFAAQAVIAMENARLLDEIRRRQEELRITFENMGDGVAMFDETPRLVAWNRKFQDILDLPDGVLAERLTFPDYIRYLTERGEYGAGANPEEQIRHLTGQADEYRAYERTRPDGRVVEIRRNPVAGGGFVLIYADITERKQSEAEIRAARDSAEATLRDLKAAQANLIQAEKMASLGQLTAGIAHEIKNPLNFVNNFAALSVDLLSELKETAAPGFAALTDDQRADIDEVSAMLTSNLEKITEHGKRADGIVKAMLEHSRGSSAERRMVDLNVLIDEALNLAYHGARAQDQSFNIPLERDLGAGIAPIEVNPQDMTRVFLNLFSNGFYAATKRARNGEDAGFAPMLKVTTRTVGDVVEIRVRDNGTGIPVEIRDKLFQPFFTTKPTGEGTGLGLSITYDIVTKQHGGTITVESEVDAFTEFVVTLPRDP